MQSCRYRQPFLGPVPCLQHGQGPLLKPALMRAPTCSCRSPIQSCWYSSVSSMASSRLPL